jgi:hypothetical protein
MRAASLLFALAALAAACTASPEPNDVAVPERPDLIVSGSCHRVEDTQLLAVSISNRGASRASPSTTRVDFRSDPTQSFLRETRTMAARSVQTFELDIPPACFRADCQWKIIVDSANQVDETDEGNNTFAGRC